jgi:hypothetical protein
LSLAPHTSGYVIHRRSAAALVEYGDRMYAHIANFSQSPPARGGVRSRTARSWCGSCGVAETVPAGRAL